MKELSTLLLIVGMMIGSGMESIQAFSLSRESAILSKESITIKIKKPSNPPGGPRVPSAVQIEAEYDEVEGAVFVYLANAGVSVDVTIENLTTGESTGDTVSGSGIAAIPISGTSGTWVITFTLLNGDVYEGEFVL